MLTTELINQLSFSKYVKITIILIAAIIGFLVVEYIIQNYQDRRRFFIDSGGHIRNFNKEIEEDFEDHNENEMFHKMFNTSLADELYQKVRILCVILTSPKYHNLRARHVKATWGKRCTVLLFMSTSEDTKLPTIVLNVTEGWHYLWAKTKESFKYVYEHHINDADWFLKADDDTYVIMENLRYMLHFKNPQSPIYYGCRYKPFTKQGYMSGGAGYVLSKEALTRLVQKGLPDKNKCDQNEGGSEDILMGKCLAAIKVKTGDSRDPEKRGTFFPLRPSHVLISRKYKLEWYLKYRYYKEKTGLACCSDYAISFHYIQGELMYLFEYFLYHLKPFGIAYKPSLENLNQLRMNKNEKNQGEKKKLF